VDWLQSWRLIKRALASCIRRFLHSAHSAAAPRDISRSCFARKRRLVLQHQRASRLNLSSVDYCCWPTSSWFAGVRSPAALVAHLRLCSQGYCFCGGRLSTHGWRGDDNLTCEMAARSARKVPMLSLKQFMLRQDVTRLYRDCFRAMRVTDDPDYRVYLKDWVS
jgi:hypothetical protein